MTNMTSKSDWIAILTPLLPKRYKILLIYLYVTTTSHTDKEAEEFYSEISEITEIIAGDNSTF